MSSERLRTCFQALRSTGELVLTSAFATTLDEDPLRCAWAAAEADAVLAYDAWRERATAPRSRSTGPLPIAPARRRMRSPPHRSA